MSKKQSLTAALQTFERGPKTATPPASKRPRLVTGDKDAASTQAPSRHGKKALIGYFDPGVSKQLKQMALDNDSNVQEILREALNDLFQKYKKPTIA